MKTTKQQLVWLLVLVLAVTAVLIGVFSIDSTDTDPDSPATSTEVTLTTDQEDHINSKRDLIRVKEPEPLESISSPLDISGEARGQWFFEANFTIRLMDAAGNELGEHYATAQDEWMTEDFVPFSAELDFSTPSTETGTLILEKANPSGLEENADELRIPVQFTAESETVADMRTVELYYYNPEADTDDQGNIMCSAAGLTSVEREIPVTQTPLQDTVRLLLEGEITTTEAEAGITTEFPLEGLELEGVSRDGGAVTLGFSDPQNQTSGGSCRAGILWQQIRETAEQFDGVEEVNFQPAELFQP